MKKIDILLKRVEYLRNNLNHLVEVEEDFQQLTIIMTSRMLDEALNRYYYSTIKQGKTKASASLRKSSE